MFLKFDNEMLINLDLITVVSIREKEILIKFNSESADLILTPENTKSFQSLKDYFLNREGDYII